MPDSRIDRLPNGLTTVVYPMPGTHRVLVSLMVRVGSRYEAARESGISHFLEHVLFRGNAGFPDSDALNRAFESVGSPLNAHTGVESTEFDFVAHPAHLAEGLGHLAQFIRAPTFAELGKERQILLDELIYDYNEQGLLINLAALSSELMWPEHPLGQSVAGVPATVNALDEPQLRAHHARHYRPANMVLGMVGNLTPEEGFALARRHFGPWQAGGGAPASPAGRPAGPPPGGRGGGPHLKLVPTPDNQFHLQLSFPAAGYNDSDELALILLSRTLDDGPTSRLQRVIREEHALVYHIQADYTSYWDTGAFDVSTSVKTDRLEPLLRCLLAELVTYREQGPSADEVERARLRHLFELEFDRDSLSARMERYVWPHLHATVRDEGEERTQLERLTPAHLRELAARLFQRAQTHLALVGPLEADSEARVRTALETF